MYRRFITGPPPNKFFDYDASGIPVLNNYPCWLADMIREHGCGVEGSRRFADALAGLADDRQGLARMGQQAKKLAESEFSRSLLADRWSMFSKRHSAPG